MAKVLREMVGASPAHELSFEARIGMLVDREWTDRDNRRLARRIIAAKLAIDASLEDVVWDSSRGLDKAVVGSSRRARGCGRSRMSSLSARLASGRRSSASPSLRRRAAQGFRALSVRSPRLVQDLAPARADGTYRSELQRSARFDVLVLDDFLLGSMKDAGRRDLLEVLEDRYDRSSTVITSQLLTKVWHEALADPTIADVICDRLVHNAHLLALRRPWMRKKKGISSETT